MFLSQNGPLGHCELKQSKQLNQLNRDVADVIDLIVLIHNGVRCEIKQLNQLNPMCFCVKTVPGTIVN